MALLSAASTFGIGRWKQLGFGKIALLILGPVADACVAYLFLDWCSVSGITLWAGAFSFGLISHILLQPLLIQVVLMLEL